MGRAAILLGAVSAPLLLSAGCVERELVVETDPPGAVVYVDGARRGVAAEGAPVVVPFDFYGTRAVVARKDGWTPVRREVALDPPWYQLFPLDLFAELLWPGTVRDVHEVEVTLERRPPPEDPGALESRARHFAETAERRP